jgi:hypothetical protein
MNTFIRILAIIFILVGILWILQGINVVPGSIMSGHIQYSIYGIIVAAIGVIGLVFANRRARHL